MSQKRRQAIFSERCTGHNVAPCCLCGQPIHRHTDQWIIEHKRALGLLGSDANPNCAPAHEACRRQKDKQDLARIAKAKRQADAGARKEKPAFARPADRAYDWRCRRYVRVDLAPEPILAGS
jgi:5-methylcytosine-specific restriction endonuclease McrA